MKLIFRAAILFSAMLFLSACTFDQEYSVIFLGDTHFDGADEKYHPAGISKARDRDTEMWKERLPAMMKAANGQATEDTAFVLQAGDMVEGGSGTAGAHKNMLVDGYKALQSFFSVPLLTVAGNHDVSSRVQKGEPAASVVYSQFAKEYVLPAINRIEGVSDVRAAGSDFAFRYGKDLYLIVNFNNGYRGTDFIRKALEENADARYKIVLCHAGPIPWDYNWLPGYRLYGTRNAKQQEMLELFQKYNCVFLVGHIHAIAALEYTTDKGSIHQIMGNCVWLPWDKKPIKITPDDPANYGRELLKGRNQQAMTELVNQFKPGIKKNFLADGAGYMTLQVNDDNITVNYFHHADTTPAYTFRVFGE